MKRTILTLALLTLGPAIADTPPVAKPAAHHNADEPIGVSADNFTAEKSPVPQGQGVINGTYTGNVVITQGDVKLRAETVRILVVNGHAEKVFASGHIVADSPTSGTATGDDGVYDVGPRIITLNGHVVLTKEKNVMRGSQLTVNMVTGIANLGGGVKGKTGGGRVQGLFTPPPQKGGK